MPIGWYTPNPEGVNRYKVVGGKKRNKSKAKQAKNSRKRNR